MDRKNMRFAGLLAIAALLLAVTGCAFPGGGVRVGRLQTESQSVELGSAASVRTEIDMGAGELEVSGGAGGLLEADFTYNVAELKPEVSFSGDRLTVRSPDVRVGIDSIFDADEFRNEWDLRLNDGVPMDLEVKVGAGRADLVLGRLSLTSLDVEAGAGDVTVDLAGASSLTRLNIDMGAGKVTVDLTGDWQTDLDADFDGGVGELTMRFPRAVGVRVNVDGGLGHVDARGFSKDGDVYTNDAYGESEVTLRVNIDAGVGQINLEQ